VTPRRSFRRKLVLLAVLVEAFMLALIVWNSVRLMRANLLEQAELRMQQLGATLQPSLVAALALGKHATVEELVAESRAAGGLARVAVYGTDGRLQTQSVDPGHEGDDGLLVKRFQLEHAGLRYGSLEIAASNEFLRRAQKALITESVLIALIEVAVSAFLLIAAGRWLTRQLEALHEATSAWARGRLEVEAQVVTDDEIGALAVEFNRMACALRTRVQALRDAREQFRALADYTYSWESWFGPNGELRWLNPSVERITGYTVSECLAMPDYPLPLFHPDDHDRIRSVRQRAAAGEWGEGEELRVIAKNGDTRWVRLAWQPIYGEGGRNLGTRTSVVDITRLKLTEAALRLSEARFAEAERVARLGHWDWNLATGRIHWSAEVSRLLGVPHGQIFATYDAFLQHVPDEDRAALQEAVRRAFSSHEPVTVAHKLVRANGEVLYVLEQGRVERDANGAPTRLFGTIQDITELKAAQLELARLNRLYAVLSEVNKAVVRESSAQALFERVCGIAVEVGGLRLAWIGRVDGGSGAVVPVAVSGPAAGYIDDLRLSLTAKPFSLGPVAQSLLTGRSQVYQDIASEPLFQHLHERCETWGLRSVAAVPLAQDGTARYTLTVYAGEPHFFSADVVELLETLAADVSVALQVFAEAARRREAEAQLIKLNAQLEDWVAERTRALEAANRELEAFSYSVSHDLRAPLRSIIGFSRHLNDRYADQLDDIARDYFRRILRASQRMSELIDDLLKLSRIGRQGVRPTEVSLTDLAWEVIETLRQNDPGRQVQVEIEGGLVAWADRALVRIVLENLLANAWKFSARKPDARIRFGSVMVDGEQALVVQDNGAGFDSRYVHKLFTPFQRLHRADEFEGSGIGLATVQRIIAKHGGRVWAEGEVGVGASFYFTLGAPLRGGSVQQPAAAYASG